MKFLLLITRLQTYLYFSNWPNQLVRQYFTRQLVQVSLFANILPLQNFPTYGMCLLVVYMYVHVLFVHIHIQVCMSACVLCICVCLCQNTYVCTYVTMRAVKMWKCVYA